MKKLIIIPLFLLFNFQVFAEINPFLRAAEEAKNQYKKYIKYIGYCVSCKQKVILRDIKFKDDLKRRKVYFLGRCIHCGTSAIISIENIPEIEIKTKELQALRVKYANIKVKYEIEQDYWFKFFWIKL